jgi:hypothetical protein
VCFCPIPQVGAQVLAGDQISDSVSGTVVYMGVLLYTKKMLQSYHVNGCKLKGNTHAMALVFNQCIPCIAEYSLLHTLTVV